MLVNDPAFRRLACPLALVLAVAAGCNRDLPTPLAPPAQSAAIRFGPADIVVMAGSSIQAAVDAAAPGSTIRIEPGVYAEAITVSKPGIHLIGAGAPGDVVVMNPGDEEDGISVTDRGDRFTLANVTVRGFEENGVILDGVQHFLIADVVAENDGEYGLYPVHSAFGTIQHASASGHSDTGIYVGQSRNVVIRESVAFGNVNGFEIENCSLVRLTDSEAWGNTAGLLVVLLPGLDVKESSDIEVMRNSVHDNNLPNFADPADIAAAVPAGSGILVVGTDRTRVKFNTVTGNDFVGIGLGSTLLLGALAGLPPEAFADIQPDPDLARIQHNILTDNGGAAPSLPVPLPGADLLWDGSGVNDCWGGNTFGTSYPAPLPACG